MRFKTHKEIGNHYRKLGLDVDVLNEEFRQTAISSHREIKKAKAFLKENMGFKYYLWTLFTPNYFGEIKEIEKAKEYGFKTK